MCENHLVMAVTLLHSFHYLLLFSFLSIISFLHFIFFFLTSLSPFFFTIHLPTLYHFQTICLFNSLNINLLFHFFLNSIRKPSLSYTFCLFHTSSIISICISSISQFSISVLCYTYNSKDAFKSFKASLKSFS